MRAARVWAVPPLVGASLPAAAVAQRAAMLRSLLPQSQTRLAAVLVGARAAASAQAPCACPTQPEQQWPQILINSGADVIMEHIAK